MPQKVKVMYVEDKLQWQKAVGAHLQSKYDVEVFGDLLTAQKAFSAGKFDVVVCDGSVNQLEDGVAWVRELQSQGKRAILLAGSDYPDVPNSMNKGCYDKKQLFTFINRLMKS